MFGILIIILFLSTLASAAGELPVPSSIEILGPIPPPPKTEKSPLSPQGDTTFELDPLTPSDADIDLGTGSPISWKKSALDQDGCIVLEEAGVYWLKTSFEINRFSRFSITFPHQTKPDVFIDGKREKKRNLDLARGRHRLMLRLDVGDEPHKTCLSLAGETDVSLTWDPRSSPAPSRFEDLEEVKRYGPMAISETGSIARSLRWRQGASRECETVIRGEHDIFLVGGNHLAPERFRPGSGELLLSENDKDGTSLWLFSPTDGRMRRLCTDETHRPTAGCAASARMRPAWSFPAFPRMGGFFCLRPRPV